MSRTRKVDWWLELNEDEGAVPERSPKPRRPRLSRYDDQLKAMLAEELYQEENNFGFTYKAGRHEQLWISSALQAFYQDSLITDVLHIVKGGKEANVYCCRAHPKLGLNLVAAKIYRPRLLRNLKNDAIYKEGRGILAEDGKTVRDGRSMRAIAKKTRIGAEMTITSWIEHEYQTLQVLHEAGANVPRPVAQLGNTILMEYIGEENAPAPTLHSVRISASEAPPLFDRLVHNISLMLSKDRIHADLSAYNVLYWEGRGTIIDFPQVVDPLYNPRGYDLLQRDIERTCQYFEKYGVSTNASALASRLWNDYLRRAL